MCRSPWLLSPAEGAPGGRHFGVLRHAERADGPFATAGGARWTQSEDYARWPLDPPLSDEGLASAQRIAAQVAESYRELGSRVNVVVTSPYLRCLQTAAALCDQLGPSVRLVVDNALGEVHGPSVMGPLAPSRLTRPVEELPGPRLRSRVAACKVRGDWPAWPEDASAARQRFAGRFLWYVRWACKAKYNFLLVTHGDCVCAALRVLPSHAEQAVGSVDYGGRLMVSLGPDPFRFSPGLASPKAVATPKKRQLTDKSGGPTRGCGAGDAEGGDSLQATSPKKRQLADGGGIPGGCGAWEPDSGDAWQAPLAWRVRTDGVQFCRAEERRPGTAALAKRLGMLSSGDCSPARELLQLLARLSPELRGALEGASRSGEEASVQADAARLDAEPALDKAVVVPEPGHAKPAVLTDIRQSLLLKRRSQQMDLRRNSI